MRLRLSAALITAAALMTTAGAARAEDAAQATAPSSDLPVTVLTVLTPDAFDLADALTVALKRAIEDTPGYATTDKDQALQILVLTLQCGDPAALPGTVVPDGACEAKISERLKADRYVWARITKKGAFVHGDVHFVQRGKPTQSAPLEYSANLNDGSDVTLIDVARDALAKAGAGSPTGKVKVFAGKLSGTLWVDGKQVGQMTDGKGELDATAGAHKIVLKTAGGSEIASEFKMAPLGETTVILSPPPPAVAGFDGKIAVGFGLVAIGVGFAAGGVYSTVRLHSIQGDFDDHYKANYGRSQDACTTKRQPLPLDHNRVLDLCNEASTLKTIQFAFYPIAAVAAGVGFTLLGVANWHPDRPLKAASIDIEPYIGLDGGAMTVRTRF